MTKRKKKYCLHIISSLRRGGRERQLATIVKNSSFNNGIIYFNDTPGNSYIEEYDLHKSVHRIEANPLKRILNLLRYCKINRPDVIISWGIYESIIGLIVSFVIKAKFINASIRHGIRDKKFSHYLRTFVLLLSPYVIANSYAGLRANNLKVSKNRYILYNGKETSYKEKIDKAEKLSRLYKLFPKIRDDEIIFITVANLVPFKDYITVLNALANIQDVFSFRYLIIGDGPMEKELIELSERLKINERIYFAGRIDDVLYFLQMADVMIHSSKGEGISNAILEGMFAGLPVIATDVGGVPETVSKYSCKLFNYRDIDGLTRILGNINALINQAKENQNLTEEFLAKFSLKSMILNYENIIRRITEDEI